MRTKWLALALALAPVLAPAPAAQAQQDCQQDFGCLIQAARACQPSRATRTMSVTASGIALTATTQFEIRGQDSGSCVLYQRTERASARFEDEMLERYVASGLSRDQAREEETRYNQAYSAQATGQDGTCRMPSDDVASLLTRLSNNEPVPYDTLRGRCEGPLFAPPPSGP
jgi:hypothetical protein